MGFTATRARYAYSLGGIDVYTATVSDVGTTGVGGPISHDGPLGVTPLEVLITPKTAFTANNTSAWAWTATDTSAGTVTVVATVENSGSIMGTAQVSILFAQQADQDGGSLPY